MHRILCNNILLPHVHSQVLTSQIIEIYFKDYKCQMQWRTQRVSWGGFIQRHMVDWWWFVFGVRRLWRHKSASYSCYETNVFAKFIDTICITFCTYSLYLMCRCTEYELLALQVMISEENKLNAVTQQFIIAKISGCALKNTLITMSVQFTTAKSSCANVLSNTSSGT